MTRPLERVVERLRSEVTAQALTEVADAELLERFVASRDDRAFTALVHRHGGMVLALCRRRLRHSQDAEDACQAVFVVLRSELGRSAGARRSPAGCMGVALHVTSRLRHQLALRRRRESTPIEPAADAATAEVSWREAQAVLDEEMGRLPEKYRAPLVLCYLEGKTQDEAARQLGWNVPTLRGRLERARQRLRFRLTRRGLTLSACLLSIGLAPAEASARQVLQMAYVVSQNSVSPQIAALVQGVLRAMWWKKAKMFVGAAMFLLLVGLAALVLPYRGLATTEPDAAEPVAALDRNEEQPEPAQAKIKITYPTMIFRAEVEKELNLTAAQKQHFKKTRDEVNKKFDDETKKIEAMPAVKEHMLMAKLQVKITEEMTKQLRDQLAKTLDAKQLERLRQLDLQWQAWEMTTFVNKDIADGLKFSEKQRKDAAKFFQDLHVDLGKLRGDPKPGVLHTAILLDDHMKAMDKMQPIAAKRWAELLTAAQRDTWATWIGKPFKFDMEARTPKYK